MISETIINQDLAQQNGQEFLKNVLYREKGGGWGVDVDGFGCFHENTYPKQSSRTKYKQSGQSLLPLWAFVVVAGELNSRPIIIR